MSDINKVRIFVGNNDKITRYNIADEILQLVIETGGNIHDIVKTINEKYQLDLNEDKYYKGE